jgi:apolipoprotein N-acyltransferase
MTQTPGRATIPRVRGILLAVVAGVALFAAFPPWGQAYLAIPAVVGFLWAVRSAGSVRWAAMTGAAFGASFFGPLFPWLTELGLIAFLPLWIVQSAYPALYAMALWWFRHLPPIRWWSTAVGGWALVEMVRGRFPLGGFEWGFVGYTAGEYAFTRQATQWIGTTGWSVVAVAVAAGVVVAIGFRVWSPLLVAAGAFVVLGSAATVWPATSDGAVVRVAIIQGSTPCPGSHCVGERRQTYDAHLELTNTIEPGTVDLVVWPEGSSGGATADPILNPEVGEAMAAAARRLGAVLIAGGDRPISDTRWVNANVVFDRTGAYLGEYRKRHPVPFGEFIPARPLFGWIEALDAVPRDMVPGEDPVVFDLDFGVLGSVISWEGSFARFSRDEVREGAEVLVVATNQGSYPLTYATDQLIGMTRMRSAELGTDLLHAGVVGKSTIITDSGVVGDTTGRATSEILLGEVQTRTAGPTLYARLGDWLQWLAIVAGIATWVGSRLRAVFTFS